MASKTSGFGNAFEHEFGNDQDQETSWNDSVQSSALAPETFPELQAQNDDDDNDDADGWGDDDDLDEITNDVELDADVTDNHDISHDTDIVIDDTNYSEARVDDDPDDPWSVKDESTGNHLPENTSAPVPEEPVVLKDTTTTKHSEHVPPSDSPLRTKSSPPKQQEKSAVVKTFTIASSTLPKHDALPLQRPLVVDMDYNSDDDILPTRQRWVNPRPDRSYLFQ